MAMTGLSGGLNCTSNWDSVNADNDIVGPGVLAAFFVTATITILAVILGYLSDSLDEEFQNGLDRDIINRVGKFSVVVWLSRVFRRHKASNDMPISSSKSHDKGQRKEAFTRFILTLSDQQLVTGLAVLIASVTAQKRLTGYEFNVALSLAWFSSTTHMTTLDVLRKNFRDRHMIRHLRVAGMLSILILLIYMFIVSTVMGDTTTPIQCIFSFPQRDYISSTDMSVDVILGMCSFSLVLFLIISGYLVRIQGLYLECKDASYTWSWLIWKLKNDRSKHITHAEVYAEYQAFTKVRSLQRIEKVSKSMRLLLSALYRYEGSFLSSFSGVVFSYTYGISQVILDRWIDAINLSSEASYMGFGQITAIFLLCLPFLNAAETYADYQHERVQWVHHETRNQPLFENLKKPMRAWLKHPVDKNSPTLKHEVSQDLLSANVEYGKKSAEIKRIFPRDVRKIYEMEKHATVCGRSQLNQQISQRKWIVLTEYERLKALEASLPVYPAIVLFFFDISTSIILGVILNISGESLALGVVGLLMFSCQYSGGFVMTLISAIGPYVKAGEKQVDHLCWDDLIHTP